MASTSYEYQRQEQDRMKRSEHSYYTSPSQLTMNRFDFRRPCILYRTLSRTHFTSSSTLEDSSKRIALLSATPVRTQSHSHLQPFTSPLHLPHHFPFFLPFFGPPNTFTGFSSATRLASSSAAMFSAARALREPHACSGSESNSEGSAS